VPASHRAGLSARLFATIHTPLTRSHNMTATDSSTKPRIVSAPQILKMSTTSDNRSQICDVDSLIPQPGFGFEFNTLLVERLSYHQDQADARLKRYGRFGMTREEALRATPDHYRQQYDGLLKDVLMEDTPPTSPSPSPSYVTKEQAVEHPREPTRYKSSNTRKHLRLVHGSSNTKEGRPKRARGRKTSSTHGMETRLQRSRRQLHTRSPFLTLPY